MEIFNVYRGIREGLEEALAYEAGELTGCHVSVRETPNGAGIDQSVVVHLPRNTAGRTVPPIGEIPEDQQISSG